MRSLVSIIIPSYNRKHLLADAVLSCLEQTYPNIEIIIVDDGSTDGTEAFVEQQILGIWAGRVKYYCQGNAGASAARNNGLERAQGKYIQFLDSDDILLKDKILLQVEQLELLGNVIDGCSCYGLIGSFAEDISVSRRIGIECLSPANYIHKMCTGTQHGMSTPAPLWKRSFLVSQLGWRTDISLGDDLEYYLRLLTKAKGMGFVDQDLFWVREHDGPRLSDAQGNRNRVFSAINTHSSIVETVKNSGNWDSQIQAGILRHARTLYANILDCGTENDIFAFEQWILTLVKECKMSSLLALLIRVRRIVGRKAVLGLHRSILRLRAIKNNGASI